MHQIRFRLGLPDPAGGAYSTAPDPLAGFGGRFAGGGRGWAGEEEGSKFICQNIMTILIFTSVNVCTGPFGNSNKGQEKVLRASVLYRVTSCCIMCDGTKNLTRNSRRYGALPGSSWHRQLRKFSHSASPF